VCFAAKKMGRRWVHNPLPRPNRGMVMLARLVERFTTLALILAVLAIISTLLVTASAILSRSAQDRGERLGFFGFSHLGNVLGSGHHYRPM
jgi:hypothetical protein